jgi:hypothetical protein
VVANGGGGCGGCYGAVANERGWLSRRWGGYERAWGGGVEVVIGSDDCRLESNTRVM